MALPPSDAGGNSSHNAVIIGTATQSRAENMPTKVTQRPKTAPAGISVQHTSLGESPDRSSAGSSPTGASKPQNIAWGTEVGQERTLADPLNIHPTNPNHEQALALVLTEDTGAKYLGFAWPTWKKWLILTVIFVVQLSMNFNASVYASAFHGVSEKYGVTVTDARLGQLLFLILYGIGSELWAPWSEELGRWPVLQGSLLLVNLTQIMCALAPTFPVLIAGRCLGGLFSAGGSVTLGMVADMWGPDEQQYAVAYVVLSSVAGSALGPVAGGFLETYCPLVWIFWVQLGFGAAVQALHFFVPETRTTILLDRGARHARTHGGGNVWGPGEVPDREAPGGATKEEEQGLTLRKVLRIWARPFVMFATEPIVLFLSLLSGFSDSLIFTFFESWALVLAQWGFNKVQTGISFSAILVGYLLAYLIFLPFIRRDVQRRKKNPKSMSPESRLFALLFVAPLEPIGLFGFAWLSPPLHWVGSLFMGMLIAIANFAIYMATIDYMVASYGPFSASATGGNALARDVLAGLAALYSTPFYEYFSENKLAYPTTILGGLAVLVAVPIYVFYWYGPPIRRRSKFAQQVEQDRVAHDARVESRRAGGRTDVEASGATAEAEDGVRLRALPTPAPAPVAEV